MLDDYREPAKVVADILQSEMELDAGHCLLGDQEWDLPSDRGLFAVVFDDAQHTIGTTTEMDQTGPLPAEVQKHASIHDIRIEIMSFDNSARTRKVEVSMALTSFFAQQKMEEYNCQISRPQAPTNATETEVTGRLHRYVIRVRVTCLQTKTKTSAQYFDKFNGAVVDATINAPEVNINE